MRHGYCLFILDATGRHLLDLLKDNRALVHTPDQWVVVMHLKAVCQPSVNLKKKDTKAHSSYEQRSIREKRPGSCLPTAYKLEEEEEEEIC